MTIKQYSLHLSTENDQAKLACLSGQLKLAKLAKVERKSWSYVGVCGLNHPQSPEGKASGKGISWYQRWESSSSYDEFRLTFMTVVKYQDDATDPCQY